MLSQISIGDNVCDSEQSSSAMDPNRPSQNLSASLQSPDSCGILDDGVSQRMVALNISGKDVLVSAFDSISRAGASLLEDDDKSKDILKADDASESKCLDNVYIVPQRRSGHNSKLSWHLATIPAKSGRRTAVKKTSVDLNSLQITRKRRSYCRKQARSSVWGLLENMIQSSEHKGGIEIAPNSKTAKKGGRGNGKHGKNQSGRNSWKSKGKSSIPTGPISLKVKFGPRCLMDVIPLVDNDIDKNYTTGEELKEFPKIVSNVDDSLEEFPSMQLHGCNGNLDNEYVSVSDVCLPGKNISQNSAAISLDCHHESLFQEGTLIDNRCSDPGTSPDSEVINLIPDTPISVRVPEDLHVLTSSKPCAAPGDAPSLIMHEKNSKKGREKDRLPNSGCGVKDLFSPESMSNAQILGHFMQGEKQRVVSYCSDSSALTIAGNGLGHMSSGDIFSGELLPCSGVSYLGTSCASSKLEFGLQGNLSSSIGTESPESEFSEILVSSHDDRKVSSGGRPKVFIKSRSGFPKSSKRREYAPKKKGNQKKQDITHEVNKNALVKGLGEVKGQSGTGNGAPSEIEQVGSGKLNLDGGISNVDILRSEVGEQHHLLPRKAWVQCDVCHKWRRIPAALADEIEETNCKWTCKENLDKLFADCSIDQEKSNSEINAELEISDASGDEGASGTCFYSKRSGQQKPLVVHQSSWTLIKSNLFLHRSRKNQTIDEIMVCHCKPRSDGRMGCGDECLNRMLNIECVRRTCPCGEFCSNQQFQKRDYAKLECFKCGKKGHGLQLLEDVSEGQFLIEYVGEVLDMHAYEARQHEYALRGHKHFYFMTLNGSEVIDACAKGNLGRFVNHSCDPNCRTEKWMVNGEVCIGLFALRDIKKGEELTFDYNYVRVFGAAAKKCVCGSPQCRGYIGGDLLNAEVVVQDDSDDEYPEPVVLGEDGNLDKLDSIISATNSFNVAEIRTQQDPPENKNMLDESSARDRKNSSQTHLSNILSQENVNLGNTVAAISLNVREESKNFPDGSPASALKMETSVGVEGLESLLQSPIQPLETSLSSEDASETMSGLIKECSLAGEVMKCSLSSAKEVEVTPLDAIVSKSLKKSQSGNGQHRHDSLKSCPLLKNTRESSAMKKGGKQKNTAVKSLPDVDSKLQISQPQYKKRPDGSSNDRFVAVEEKLNELLGHDGGISKHKDASKCYLKLLLLTAASGDSCNGEAIQSNRGLSMILDALLKTKSRTVLVDIINKNGLQMLHNIMKRYRREFNKIPILRKLLKILEHLAVREILSHEHINGSPSRPGVESFRDSILRLTEHTDKQVHQIARNFRDRWIPRPLRKIGCIERDDSRMDSHSGSYYNRCSSLQNQSCDRGAKPSAETENTCHSTVASTQPDASMLDGSSASCSDIGVACEPRKRKRKSRWDQEAEPNSDPRIASNVADDRRQVVDDDLPPGYEFPPGFSIPINGSGVLCDASSTAVYSLQEHSCRKQPHPVVIGHLQQRFISRLPVSYGIPYPKVQEFGTPLKERFNAWDIAPGIPFQPFPPLPPYPRTRTFSIPSASSGALSQLPQSAERDCHTRLPGHSAQNPPSISGTSLPQDSAGTQLRSQPAKDSHNVERNFFRKQHFNKVPPPWIRGRSGWGIHRRQL